MARTLGIRNVAESLPCLLATNNSDFRPSSIACSLPELQQRRRTTLVFRHSIFRRNIPGDVYQYRCRVITVRHLCGNNLVFLSDWSDWLS